MSLHATQYANTTAPNVDEQRNYVGMFFRNASTESITVQWEPSMTDISSRYASTEVLFQQKQLGSQTVSTYQHVQRPIRSPIEDKFPEGGTRAWLVTAGAAGILFSTMGYTNSFGVFQAYYMANQLKDETPDRISWIGSVQAFLMFAAGCVGGPLFDRYGTTVIRPAVVVYLFAVMMTSLCQEYWQFMLAQGLLTGTTCGLLIFPAMACVSQYFEEKRAAAMGAAMAGSSIGAVVFPVALSKLLNASSLGFGWTVRTSAFIMLPILAFSTIVVRTRLPPRTTNFIVWSAFKGPTFDLLILSVFFMFIGMFTPLFYLPAYGIAVGMEPELASYLVAILNGASTFGRIIPGVLADKFGRLNLLACAGFSTGIVILCWPRAETSAALIVYSAFFGFTSGAIVSGSSTAFAVCSKYSSDVGTYMGMGMALSSIAALIGPPVNGALLDKYNRIDEVSIFSGAICLVGALCVLLSKGMSSKGLLGNI